MGIKRTMGIFRLFLVYAILAFLIACSHGGGGDDGGASPESNVTVNGLAAAGPIAGGTVSVYALAADGTKGALLNTTTSHEDGTYSVSVGSYSGNILVEVTGGTYTDEATQEKVENTLLRAALTGVSGGNVTLAVTPLTELAVRLAEPLTTESINKGNTLVSCMIGVNITGVLPVDITNQQASEAASAEQGTYGLMLAVISQMSGGKTQGDTINELKNDLSDGRMDATGSKVISSLEDFIVGSNNKSGVGVDTLEDTVLYKALVYVINNKIEIKSFEDMTELNKAKKLVTDLRNTVLSIYNYQGVGAAGIFNTPVVNIESEILTEATPELANTMNRIQEVFSALPDLDLGSMLVGGSVDMEIEEDDGLALTLTVDKTGESAIKFTLHNESVTVGSGTAEVDDMDQPTSGSLDAVFQGIDSDEQVTMNAAFTAQAGTIANTYESMTFTGSMKIRNIAQNSTVLEIDFSQSGRRLSAVFAPIPTGGIGVSATGFGYDYTVNSYPTSVFFAGLVKSKSARLNVSIDVDDIVYVGGEVPIRPRAVTVTGTFEALAANGSPSGTKFTGTINGGWTNAEDFHFLTEEEKEEDIENVTESNWPQWSATFSGTIEAPSRPTITASLGAAQNAWDNITFDVNFKRTNPDGSVMFISGTGAHNTTTDVTTGNLSNQDGLKIVFDYDPNRPEDRELAGTIKSAGGVTQAHLYSVEGAPVVKFIDNYFETLF